MAGLFFTAICAPIATGTADVTLVMVKAPANHRLRILAWGASFNGTDNLATPIQVDLIRATSDGTGTALTLIKDDDSVAETIQATATELYGGTNEPTEGDLLRSGYVHPQTPHHDIIPHDHLYVGGGDRVMVKLQTPAASVTAIGWIEIEE